MQHPLSLEAFADWLGTMPAAKEYEYRHIGRCAICQYFDFIGIKYKGVGGCTWASEDWVVHKLPPHFNDVVSFPPRTFGAAHQRARDILAKAQP